ncbi:hypothetical protein OG884_27850 [Streptosporangium sp. NBC_01755]|uniref:hypothetical protein n=1 Tax=unclassified Streptosporangium TaxID=2632669 RepID=UPI002DDA69F3|nr:MULTISPECIES: hypothetical protein [unclassified Streptosporangium]WSA23208.1 hypothetical protein OIE13_19750 [Streptosporangium sp. NBC_01810]WSC98653.1 hypothetical protein OG884_27850 [Streptosporangium sp. NBC_01755]
MTVLDPTTSVEQPGTTIASVREMFPMVPAQGQVLPSGEQPSITGSRPWILRLARVPDRTQATHISETFYDDERQISLQLGGGLLPYMATNKPTVVDGDPNNPPSLDEGPKD